MDFNDEMFMASEAVYSAIQRGEVPDVTAALNQAHFDVSREEDDQ